ncbi:MAG: hypothetical protein SV760_10130, partial [Halobacteria archaeon]|nr:hypothetical protein [Halobacteria archaeon]
MTPDETDKTENSNEDGTEVVNLPRWDPVHVELSTDHAGSDFFDEVVEDVEEGYIVIDLDGHPPYLLMIHEAIICEIGKLHTDGGRRNIGKGFRETSMSNVSRRMRENDGTVSVYRLPAEVCVNVCRIINSEPDYGDLNTNIVDMSDMLDRLSDDGYTGTIAFTNEKNYAYMEFRGGEPTDFWYKGEEEIETVDEFVESDVDDVEV